MEYGSLPVDARRNWWGAATASEMADKGYPANITAILDIEDNGSLRHADYSLWELGAVDTLADLKSHLVAPSTGEELQMRIYGAAIASAGVKKVEVSVDGGSTWDNATVSGAAFYYDWFPSAPGTYTVVSKVTDQNNQVEAVPDSKVVVISSGPTVSGSLTHDEIWSGSVVLQGDVFIPSGLTLTLQAGTQVRATCLSDKTFSGLDPSRIEIIVAGNLIANGTSLSRVGLDSARPVPVAGDWYGIRYLDSSSDTISILRSADISHGVQGIRLESAAPDFLDCRMQNNSQEGIYGSSGTLSKSLWRFDGCAMTGNAGAGANLTIGTDVEVLNVTSASNGHEGVYLNAGGHKATLGNIMAHSNGAAGVSLESGSTGVTLNGGTIYDNAGPGVRVGAGGTEVRIDSVAVQSNAGPGVQVDSAAKCTILASTITGNTRGIQTGSPQLVAAYNTITGNLDPLSMGSGLHSEAGDGAPSVMGMNTIENGGPFEVYLQRNANPEAPGRAVNARRNWWGSTATAEMATAGYPGDISTIYDIHDDRGAGLVDYRNWLSSAPALPGARAAHITYPASGESLNRNSVIITGVAYAAAGISRVEVSMDAGASWGVASGKESWSLEWFPPSAGSYPLQVRVVDLGSVASTPDETINVTITQNVPTTSGPLVSDESWGPGDVALTGDVIVKPGVTLTLQPNTHVKAAALTDDRLAGDDPSRVELVVQGKLISAGGAGSRITLEPDAATPAARDWYGLRFEDTADDLNSALVSTDVGAAWHGIEFFDGGPALSDVNSTLNYRNGLYVHHLISGTFPSVLSITGGSFSQNGGEGINVEAGSASPTSLTIDGTALNNNGRDGARVYWNDSQLSCALRNLTAANNAYLGVSIEGPWGAQYPSTVLHGSTFDNNGRGAAALRGDAIEVFGNIFTNSGAGWYTLTADLATTVDLYKNTFSSNSLNLSIGYYVKNATVAYNDFGATSASNFDQAGTASYGGNGGTVPQMHYNNWGDAASGIILQTGQTYGINAWGNYWGAAITAEMTTKGYPANISALKDVEDNVNLGRIDYSRFLGSQVDLAPARQSHFLNPQDGAVLSGRGFVLQGCAGADAGVGHVEVSTDGGATWSTATGGASWSFPWSPATSNTYELQCRVVDKNGVTQSPATSITVTVNVVNVTTSGTLLGDESWSGVIVLTGDVTVPAGVTLTLEPGVTVKATPNSDDTFGGIDSSRIELVIKGRLLASGSVSAPITLTSAAATPAPADWYGIRFEGTCDSSVTLSYLTAAYAKKAISGRTPDYQPANAYPDISHCVFDHASDEAVYLYPGIGDTSGPVKTAFAISDTTVTDCGGGIRLDYAASSALWDGVTFQLLRNDVSRCNQGTYGPAIQWRSDPGGRTAKAVEISGNHVSDCPYGGVYAGTTYNWCNLSALTMDDNTVSNSGDGIVTVNLTIPQGSIFRNTVTGGENGISVWFLAHASVEGNELSGGSGAGITMGHGAVVRNRITGYALQGVYFPDNGFGTAFGMEAGDVLLYDDIENNRGAGIQGGALQYPNAVIKAYYCTLAGNNGRDAVSGPDSFNWGTANPIDARSNWWGPATTAEMDGKGYPADIAAIQDIEDYSMRARVDYRNWLAGPPPDPPDRQSSFIWPRGGETVSLRSLAVEGTAYASAGIKRVEVSTDGGATWVQATGTYAWTYLFTPASGGPLTFACRVVDLNDAVESPAPSVSITVDADAPTTSGALIHDESWSGIITLTGDVTVPYGVTLTLLPGTRVQSMPLCDDQHGGNDRSRIELIISGRLNATGTALAPIVLTSAASTQIPGQWFGIRYTGTADSTAGLSRVTVEYARKGIYAVFPYDDNSDVYPDITFCTLQYLSEEAVYYQLNHGYFPPTPVKSGLTISDSTIYSCGKGVLLEVRSGDGWETFGYHFLRNAVTSIGSAGPAFAWHAVENRNFHLVEASGNTFSACAGGAIDFAYGYSYSTLQSALIENNTISGSGAAFNFGGTMTLNQGLVRGNTVTGGTDGLMATVLQTMRVEQNSFSGGSGTGIQFGRGQILKTTVAGYGGNGVQFASGSQYLFAFGTSLDDVMLYDDIHENQGHGLVDNASLSTAAGAVHFCNILNNVGDAAQEQCTGAIDARRNWWGAAMTDEMEAKGYPANILKIFDVEDDQTNGRVDYNQWLSAPVDTSASLSSRFVWPIGGETVSRSALSVQGVAYAAAGIDHVEVSTDGATWLPATGSYRWSYSFTPPSAGAYTLRCRVVAVGGAVESPGDSAAITVNDSQPTTSGTLSRDETWSGTVRLTGDVMVPSGVTLTLSGGTQVLCEPWSDDRHGGIDPTRIEIIVQGRLVTGGSSGSHVTMTTFSATPSRGHWYGVRYLAPAQSSQALSWCDFSWGYTAVSSPSDDSGGIYPDITNCTIDQMAGFGVGLGIKALPAKSAWNFAGNTVSNTSSCGVYLWILYNDTTDLQMTVSDNQISGFGRDYYGYGGLTFDIGSGRTNQQITILRNNVSGVSDGIPIDIGGWGGFSGYLRVADNVVTTTSANVSAIQISNTRRAEVTGNSVSGGFYGINAQVSPQTSTDQPYFSANRITGTRYSGLRIDSSWSSPSATAPLIYDNSITDNAGIGVELFGQSSLPPILRRNNLYGAGTFALANHGQSPVDASGNYWGASITSEMQSVGCNANITEIEDQYDNSYYGLVTYCNWASSSFGDQADIRFTHADSAFRITWSPKPTLTYDLIRGAISSVTRSGGVVNLGTVACQEQQNSSGLISDSSGNPPAGTCWFYLIRDHVTPGAYGYSSLGEVETPASGGCP